MAKMDGNSTKVDDKNTGEESAWSDLCEESILQRLNEHLDFNTTKLRTEGKYAGFDNTTGSTWIYPTNFPIRSYQFNITKASLFKNTLVVLPTGLGKTFIAAVVMYNIYRWYPLGKVIFMAPTRPLVAQQIEACRKIMGIPLADTAEMTGKQNKKLRKELWQTRRVFFATPQVIQSDINDVEQDFPFSSIKLVVVDEAHKAKGRYAYTEVVQTIVSRNSYFRVLALSATPGRNISDVVEVVRNLLISHLEVRWENSIDVSCYTHKRHVNITTVPLGEELTSIRNEFIDITEPYIRYLIENNVISANVSNMSRGWMVMEQKRFREMSNNNKHANHANILQNFSICITLYHALELLERHGTRVFLNFFDENANGKEDTSSSEKYIVAMNPRLKSFLDKLRSCTGPNPFSVCDLSMTNGEIANIRSDLDFGHPKFGIAKTFLLEHFEKNEESKVIVFCEYRESVLLLHRSLLQSRPLIRPRIFVGQGGTGSIRAVTQKEQIEVMKDFRSGKSNTLISTSVAEEGIDVGEVNMIICFDISNKNPTRFTQRIGRTGRQKKGSVIILATEGKEHAIVKEVLATKDKTNQRIAKSTEISQSLYKNSPRLVPTEFDPKCLETVMQIRDEVEEVPKNDKKRANKPEKKQKKGKNCKKRVDSGVDVRIFFNKINLDEEECEIFCEPKESGEGIVNKNSPIDIEVPHLIEDDSVSVNITKVDNHKNWKKLVKEINTRAAHLGNPSSVIAPYSVDRLVRSKTLSKCVKRFILEKNRNFVKEKYEAMKALEAISENEMHSVENFTNLKATFSEIENIFESRLDIELFLSRNKEDESERETLEKKFGHIFNDLPKRKFCDDVDSFIEERLKHHSIALVEDNNSKNSEDCSEVYNEEDKSNGTVSIIEKDDANTEIIIKADEDDVFGDNFDVLWSDSKYLSQWTQNDIKNQSTPLGKDKNKNSISICHESSSLKTFFQHNDNHKSSKNQETNIDFEISKDFFKDDFDKLEQFHSPEKNDNTDIYPHSRKSTCDEISDKLFYDNDLDEINVFNLSIVEEALAKHDSHSKKTLSFEKTTSSQRVEQNNFTTKVEVGGKRPRSSEKELADLREDLFDDDFNEFIACSSQILTQIERRNKNKYTSQKSSDNSAGHSMGSVQNILEREKCTTTNKVNIKNPDLDDFDLNDFMEPFNYDEENDIDVLHSFQSLPSQKRNIVSTAFTSAPKNLGLGYEVEVPPTILVGCENRHGNKSPERNKSTKTLSLTSPSLFLRKTNIGKLRLFCSDQEVTKNCSTFKKDTSISKSGKGKENEDISKLGNQSCKSYMNGIFDESIIGDGRLKSRKRIIESSDSEQENSLDNLQKPVSSKELQRKTHRKVKRVRCEFLDDEAGVSGPDSSDQEKTYDDGLSQFVVDSSSTDEENSDHPSINLHAKYLESVKSPTLLRGGFKIPAHRKYMDMSKICSQTIIEEDLMAYKEDSFVVTDEEEIFGNEDSEICPLEQAEAILKARRRNRRNGKNSNEFKQNIKRKRWRNLVSMCESSDDGS